MTRAAYLYDVTTGQELAKLVPSTPFANGYVFGASVDIEGATAIVGAPFKNDAGTPGFAYLFNSATGQPLADLAAADGVQADLFGSSVGVSGNLAVVGALGDDDNGSGSGSAYVFHATTGAQLLKLLPDDGAAGDGFGGSVGISGTLIVVGSGGADDNGNASGAAYLFDATTGLQLFKLLPGDGMANHDFGRSVAIHGTTVIVGASGDNSNGNRSGAAYLFDATTGLQIDKLVPADNAAGDWFGLSVDISATHAIGGAERKDGSGNETGAANVFDLLSGQEVAKLEASDAAQFDRLGTSVAMSGTIAVAGAYGDDGAGPFSGDAGSAYIYDLNGGPWLNLGKALGGSTGLPLLVGVGDLTDNSSLSVSLTNGAANAATTLIIGFTNLSVPFKGGTFVPSPDLLVSGLTTDGSGAQQINTSWPAGAPSCITFFMQHWIVDGAGPSGFAASNGLSGTTP